MYTVNDFPLPAYLLFLLQTAFYNRCCEKKGRSEGVGIEDVRKKRGIGRGRKSDLGAGKLACNNQRWLFCYLVATLFRRIA